jgi:uncharacterized protein
MENLINIKNHILSSIHNQRKFGVDLSYVSNKKPKDIIVFVHGFKGFKDWGYFDLMADYFASNGFIFIKFNLSHNGTTIEDPLNFNDLETFSENNFSIELDDINTIIDFVYENDLIPQNESNIKNLYLMGHSRGGYISIVKAINDNRIKKLITLAAVSDFESKYSQEEIAFWKKNNLIFVENARTQQQMPIRYQFYENFIQHRETLSVKSNADKLNIPWLIIHGKKDTSVPLEMAYDLSKWNKGAETYIINEADHVFGGKHPYDEIDLPRHALEAFEKTIDFIRK